MISGRKYLITSCGFILLVMFLLAGCGEQGATKPIQAGTSSATLSAQSTATSAVAPVKDYMSLVAQLQAVSGNVKPGGDVTQPFFSVKGQVIKLNGEDIQVFEYSDLATAEGVAAGISPDGYSIKSSSGGVSAVSWVAPPHFYKKEKLIVLYLGNNNSVISILQKIFGNQFAGR